MLYWILGGLLIAFGLAAAFVLLKRRKAAREGIVSVVLLQRSHRRLTESDVRGAYRRAFNLECQVHVLPLPGGEAQGLTAMSDKLPPLFVIDAGRRYFDDEHTEATVARFEHPEAREAIRSHRAWTSVDAPGGIPRDKELSMLMHTACAKLASEFYDERCMLLYAPALGSCARASVRAETLLKHGDIATLFLEGEDPREDVNAPMIHVKAGDKAVERAKQEARTRLPEFISAFERLGPERSVAIFKASFPEPGRPNSAEIIWMKMTAVSDNALTGTIENHPIRADIPKRGSLVTIPIDRIVDWAYVDEHKQPHGMFVERVIRQKA